MAHRLLPVLLLTAAAATSCGGKGDDAHPAPGTARTAAAGAGHTSVQLAQALLTEARGYHRAGEPDSGQYGSLKAIQNAARLQRETTLDKPACGKSRPGGAIAGDAPAALVTFAGPDGRTATETLMGMSAADADKQVQARVPGNCLSFRTKVGGQWASHQVTEAPKSGIGEGSRTVGVTTVAGGNRTRTWYVVFRGRHYLATITVHGPRATRDEAEALARQAHAQARKVLQR